MFQHISPLTLHSRDPWFYTVYILGLESLADTAGWLSAGLIGADVKIRRLNTTGLLRAKGSLDFQVLFSPTAVADLSGCAFVKKHDGMSRISHRKSRQMCKTRISTLSSGILSEIQMSWWLSFSRSILAIIYNRTRVKPDFANNPSSSPLVERDLKPAAPTDTCRANEKFARNRLSKQLIVVNIRSQFSGSWDGYLQILDNVLCWCLLKGPNKCWSVILHC